MVTLQASKLSLKTIRDDLRSVEDHRLGYQAMVSRSMEAGETPTYYLMPELNLIDADRTLQLLQVLRAIGQQIASE
jgi:hypothetical protein